MARVKRTAEVPAAQDWYAPLRAIVSRGSADVGPGGLAGLSEARGRTLSQFFTPDAVVRFMWELAGLDRPLTEEDRYRGRTLILDNSYGSGRMFQFADPALHELYGIEVDAEPGVAVADAARAAGFKYQLEVGSLDGFRAGRHAFDVALINPPFSIQLDTPLVEPYACNSYGRFGPRSSVPSHVYAVAQALEWAERVVAVTPLSFAASSVDDPWFAATFGGRLRAVYTLPRGTFTAEGADVEVAVMAWGNPVAGEPVARERLADLGRRSIAGFTGEVRHRYSYGSGDAKLTRAAEQSDRSAVRIPVTRDPAVRVCHNGRRLVLKFACGAIQGRTMNAVLRDHVQTHVTKGQPRIHPGVEFAGAGALDLENYLSQPDPSAAFYGFLGTLRVAGGVPEVDPGVWAYLRRGTARLRVLREPFRHVVRVSDGGLGRWFDGRESVTGICRKPFNAFGQVYRHGGGEHGSVKSGSRVELKRSGREDGEDRWTFTHNQCYGTLPYGKMLEGFTFPAFKPEPNDWTVIAPGLAEAFPARFTEVQSIARRLGLDRWCTWGYQFHDLCELALKGRGVVGWDMGLGKARAAIALCVLGQGRRNLIVVEAHLVDEMRTELRGLPGLSADDWKVIERPADLADLRRINVIAYSRLKSAVTSVHPQVTYSHRLRRRIHTLVADEAQLLRNPQTDQSRAVWRVSPKRRYAESGTPIANYPRDVLPLIQWAAGDGTAAQAFGHRHPYLKPECLADQRHAVRGVDVFREMFVTLEWVTNEFSDGLREGAKREVPKIKDVPGFRRLVAPWLKRRVMEEPEVAQHIRVPRPAVSVIDVDWDDDHLVYYYRSAREFRDWYVRENKKVAGVNLIALLARMQAVVDATNFPAKGVGELGPYLEPTSKQRAFVSRCRELAEQGHKTIAFCHSPAMVEWAAGQLADIDPTPFHGGMTVADRVRSMDKRFRFGSSPLLLATDGVLQTGYNIHQANRVVRYDRTWTPKSERQGNARVLRPQQQREVEIEYLHLPGSVDTYQAQMCDCKGEAMDAGLDYGAEDPALEFMHIETVLKRFIDDFEASAGTGMSEFIKTRRRRPREFTVGQQLRLFAGDIVIDGAADARVGRKRKRHAAGT